MNLMGIMIDEDVLAICLGHGTALVHAAIAVTCVSLAK